MLFGGNVCENERIGSGWGMCAGSTLGSATADDAKFCDIMNDIIMGLCQKNTGRSRERPHCTHPYRTQSFHFCQKAPVSDVGAPSVGLMPPMGNPGSTPV